MDIYYRFARCLILCLSAAVTAGAAEIEGEWKAEFDSPIGRLRYTYELKVSDGMVTGKAVRLLDGQTAEIELKEVRLTGDEIRFVEIHQVQGQELRIEYKGKVANDEIKFSRQVGDFATMEVIARRARQSGSVTGAWEAEFDTQIGRQKYLFLLVAEDDKVLGKAKAEIGGESYETDLSEGKLNRDEISFVEMLVFQGNPLRIEYQGTVAGDDMRLKRKVGEFATEELIARRVKQRAAEEAPKEK
jgi:hypothetical protein